MDHSCPNCDADLAQAKPVPVIPDGERKALPFRTAFACPRCSAPVKLNVHPVERKARAIDAAVMLVLVSISVATDELGFLAAAVAVGGAMEVGLWLWSKSTLRSWRRYASGAR